MDEPEKREIQEELKMVYNIDQFIDGNPYVEEWVERSHAQGLEEGLVKGRVEGRAEPKGCSD